MIDLANHVGFCHWLESVNCWTNFYLFYNCFCLLFWNLYIIILSHVVRLHSCLYGNFSALCTKRTSFWVFKFKVIFWKSVERSFQKNNKNVFRRVFKKLIHFFASPLCLMSNFSSSQLYCFTLDLLFVCVCVFLLLCFV